MCGGRIHRPIAILFINENSMSVNYIDIRPPKIVVNCVKCAGQEHVIEFQVPHNFTRC